VHLEVTFYAVYTFPVYIYEGHFLWSYNTSITGKESIAKYMAVSADTWHYFREKKRKSASITTLLLLPHFPPAAALDLDRLDLKVQTDQRKYQSLQILNKVVEDT